MSFHRFKDGRFDLIGLVKGTKKHYKSFEWYSKLSHGILLPLHLFMVYMTVWLMSGTLSLVIPQLRVVFDALTIPLVDNILQLMSSNLLILFAGITTAIAIHEIGHSISALGLHKEVPYVLCVGVFDKFIPMVVTHIKGDEKEFTTYELMSIYNGGNLAVLMLFCALIMVSLVLGPTPILSTFAFSALAILSFNVFPIPGTDAWQIIQVKLDRWGLK